MKAIKVNALGVLLAVTFATSAAFELSVRAQNRGLTIEQLIDIKHPSSPMWSPDGQSIVFVWDRAGVSKVYVATPNGPPPRVLESAGASLAGASWTHDGRALLVTRSGDLWRVPIDGSPATAIWKTPQPESSMATSPDGTRVAFIRDGELIVRVLTDGEETVVVKEPGTNVVGLGWSPDGKSLVYNAGGQTIRHEQTPDYSGVKIVYTINENVPGQMFAVAATGGTPKSLGPAGGFGPRRWIDAQRFVFDRTSPDFKRRTSSAVDIATGETTVLHEDVEDKFWSMTGDANAVAQPSPDGKWVAFLSDRDGWDHLYVMPAPAPDRARRSQPSEAIQITKGRFEAWRPVWSPDSQRIAFDANEPDHYGTRHLYVATIAGNPATAKVAAVTNGRGTDIAPQWSPDGTRLVYQHTDPQHSADLFVVNVPSPALAGQAFGVAHRLTDSMPEGIDHSAFVEPEAIRYPGPDGQQVPAWLFVPKNLDRTKKHPAIVWIHGDGVNQNYDGWHVQRNYAVYYSFHQYLLQKGYVVIAPDYRGSIGYGRAWREGVYMDVGGKDAKDAWMAANYLKTLPYVDMNRVGVWGLSYGGFFTLIAVTDQPKLFRAAVDVAGVVDYAMYYEDPYHGGWTQSRIGRPDQHPDVYANASPISHVDRLETPLLVLHGTSDVNVPYLHSVRLIDELMKKGKGGLVSFMTYPGEFHYFTREHVLRDAWHRVDDFFGTHLNAQATATH
jgi:dipeptidyl aminopeptidase/acylaminoacyl peptidase